VRRGELYRVFQPISRDPKRYRVYVIVSRQVLLESRYSTVICAPVFSEYDGLLTQVPVGVEEGLKHDSSIHCDSLVSLPKSLLTNYVGTLSLAKVQDLNQALAIAVGILV
jgi:mRNA interferase MazF